MLEYYSMNFLAHAYLSFGQEEILIGNFIGDFVKGKNLHTYPAEIQNGILLHREIDQYTDRHPAVKLGQSYLRPFFGHYSTVITDIYFDYFLAKNWGQYSAIPLEMFVKDTYASISKHRQILPPSFLEVFFWMESQNWLVHYQTIEGVHKALSGLARRARFDSKMEQAADHLVKKEEEFQEIFFAFFEDLETFAQTKLQEIQTNDASH
jgi:acyl carrier protein phosphodiesterase